ncbi:PREDICTED: midasin isoform X2 [Crocodylus porosus]|uniref:midasin isoform X2 n=1 Tax=Crocodylus porosus TaxID=8502 RepID=UPI000939610A|nr:PREDICTED: midasin isoform X2 [Crocodylus porosus]
MERARLAEPLQLVARRSEKGCAELSRLLAKQIWTEQDRQGLLHVLAQLLLDKECTLLIGRQFRPILLDLLERNAEAIKAGGQFNHDLHERLCVAMSKLIVVHPDVLPFALRYFKDTAPVFQRLFLESSDTNTVRYGRRRMKLRDLMEAAYRFLHQQPSVFRELWDWGACVPLLRSHDTLVRWYTSNCLALVTCMNDEHRLSFLKKIFSPEELIHFRLKLLEESQMQNVEKALVLANSDTTLWHKENELQYTQGEIVSCDLSANVVAICGVVLSRLQLVSKEQESNINRFVMVESTCTNLQALAIAVAFQNPVLLEGPIGCGKTSLVEYLAAVTGRIKPPHILKVQLGDQTDSKMLLGMYRCTDVPGEFVWQPGTLTQAVTKGHWILLEDIDYAPLDVISVLIPLLEKGKLLIPGRGDCLKVAPGFQFFATRRVFSCAGGWYRQQNSHAALLDKYWTKIRLNNMSKAELKEVLQGRYPNLAVVSSRLLDIYIQLTGDKHQISESSSSGSKQIAEDLSETRTENKGPSLEGREPSLRDLLNWCSRVAYNFDSSSSTTTVNVFQEAMDCFTAMLSNPGSRQKMAEIIGSKLNISKKKAEYYCRLHKPEILIREQGVSVGRVWLKRKQSQALLVQREKQTFAATRPSSVLIEQLAVCVDKGEPVLLVGETGTGKTSTVQYLAHVTGHHLRVINMNQQSDTADLLGGYKPVDNRLIWLPLRESFEELFCQTFSRKKNQTFLGHIQTCYRQKRWHDLLKLMQHIHKSAISKEAKESESGSLLKEKWDEFGVKLNHAHQQMKMTENALLFAFVEGTLAQAVKKGEWILLDEINLAAAETLECLSGLLEGSSGSLVLLDRGDTEPLVRHADFRLFACMNPATDVGKRNLPPGIRNRFTELYVEELQNEVDLQILITDYLRGLNVSKNIIQGIVNFYLSVRKEAQTKLVDGTGRRPHYSLRTLCRALRFAASNPCNSIQRSLYEGFCLSFLTQLDRISHPVVQKLICQHMISGNIKSLLKQPIPEPRGGRFIQIEGYWISMGDKEPTIDDTYVLTPSVKLNLKDIVRVVSAGTHPLLIQGETSVGKTSLIHWLAAACGNHCVRINNHEHTDIQEYIGCYTSDTNGKLIFKEGVLIDAMRKGYWIILDELNLAPTDVLEALNRLLDDNRELFITETQELVKAHPRFMLFATQNPPGLYGGRKVLSRAFRNRFVELHFDELPSGELETILHKRCSLPPSYCSKLVKVMLDLQSYRRGSTVFAGKHGYITLRDLFRWAERYRMAEQTEKDYDWLQHLANDGFMLLTGRVRKQEEADVIQSVLEKHFKKKLYPYSLFSEESVRKLLAKSSTQMSLVREFGHIVWTQGMRRLAVLVGRALEFGEPVLLVGETGCGKTTVCQIFAALANQKLYSVNCHLHMETSDFLGGLRPIRQRSNDKEEPGSSRLFEWRDGPLVLAMREDGFFLLDEISLADDSVLERLNSVLEAEKTLVLAEKGSQEDEDNEVELLVAGKKFRILATMNPGGDFGKKELSPALRNRFTEIWCPQSNSRDDLIQIVKHNLQPGLSLHRINQQKADIAELMMDFIEWLTNQEFGHQFILSVRDVLSWVNFMNVMVEDGVSELSEECISPAISFVHAACLVYIDAIGSGISCSAHTALSAREKCLKFLHQKLCRVVELTEHQKNELRIYDRMKEKEFIWIDNFVGIHPFFIPRGPGLQRNSVTDYALNAGTTAMNAQRVLRALQLNKPILLEGSPGVGKTSLVAALANASGNCLVRINLSEQTDITDLFGTDLPVEGGKGGEFAWRDGPLLAALKAGHWIVLDELNLASQSVLEGLNACFDHRAEIYIPELGMSFHVQHKKTKIFGCQNPYRQGGGRKGLPKSFLNRFTQVYVDPLSAADMEFIGNTLFPAIDKNVIAKMVAFNNKIDQEVMVEKKWGQKGGPWEFNLRDLFRWCQLMLVDQSPGCYNPAQHVFLVYGERVRTNEDKEKVISIFKEIFGHDSSPYVGTRQFHITPYNVQIGYSVLSRGNSVPHPGRNLSLLHHSLQSLESIMKCVHMSWMVILVGPAAVGKTSLVELLAHLTGHRLKIMAMNSAMDTTELLGAFEQVDIIRPWQSLLEKVESTVSTLIRDSLLLADICAEDAEVVLRAWSSFVLNFKPKSLGDGNKNITTEVVSKLEGILSLIQRLNNKINSYSKAEFSRLMEEFWHFKLQHVQSVDGQSHGTFEWVDGMLVQALRSGDWLLMDNVNFCNPSVLDRLNALLEPGGILTMSERGVIDGSTPTIAPHPNFRLFLSMDPIHGEISRAMRNRGIEIYIPGESDWNVLDQLDLKLLLHELGLVGDSICDALLTVHSETKEMIAGSALSLSSLLHAATLIAQQLHRGIGLAKAFYRACWDVYVGSQQSQMNQKLVLELVMKHVSALSSHETWGDSLLTVGLWPDSLPTGLFAVEDSLLSTVQSDGQVLAYCLNRLNLKNTRALPLTLEDLQKVMQSTNSESLKFSAVEMDACWLDEIEVLSASVKLFIEKATNQDWMLRVRWLNHLTKNLPQVLDSVRTQLEAGAASLTSFYSSSLSAGISNVIKLLQPSMTDEHVMPLDPRWNMQLLDIVRNSLNFDTEVEHTDQLFLLLQSIANRAVLFLNREERSYIEKNSIASQKSRTSALRMSLDFHKEPGSYSSLPHAIVASLAAFFELWDAFMLHWVKSSQVTLTDEDVHDVLCSLQWRDRFWAASDTLMVDSAGLALLSLHWHWVRKHLIDRIPQMLIGLEQHKFSREIQSVAQEIQSCLSNPAGISANVKKLQKSLGRPLPFKNKLVVESFAQLKVLSKQLSVLDQRPAFGKSRWKEEICCLKIAAAGWKLKKALLQAQGLILRANHVEDVNPGELRDFVDLQYSQLKAEGIKLGPTEEMLTEEVLSTQSDPDLLTQLCSRVQLWPTMEHLALLWQYKLTADCVNTACLTGENFSEQRNLRSELGQYIAFSLKLTPATSHRLYGLWHLLHLDKISLEEMSLLWSELVNAALASFWSSTVTTDPEYWFTWTLLPDAEEGKFPNSLMDRSVKGPGILNRAVFSKCLFEILTSSSKTSRWDASGLPVLSSSHVTLGEWKERAQQLCEISTALWTNMAVSSVAEFRHTDFRLQGIMLCRQLFALKDLIPIDLQEEYSQCCNKLPSMDPVAFEYILKVLKDISGQELLPKDTLFLLLTCLQQFFGEEGIQDLSETAQRGCLWVNMGLLQIQMWLPQTRFDPAVKRECKLKYAKDELKRLQCEWRTRNLSSQLHTGKSIEDEAIGKYVHPHLGLLQERIQKLKEQVSILSRKQAYRPPVPPYDCLYQEVHQYIASIAQISAVQELLARLLQFLRGERPKLLQAGQNLLNEEASWQQSHHKFRRHLADEYALYPDAVSPLQAAILQMQHGMRLVASEVYAALNSFVHPASFDSLVTSLLTFPSVGPSFPTYLSHAETLCSVNSVEVLHGLKFSLKHSEGEPESMQRLCPTLEELLVNALLYLRCHALSKGELDQKSLQLFRHLCQAIINEWDEQERRAQEQEALENSLYRYRSKSYGTGQSEEEEEEREFRRRFPLHEKDFQDIIAEPSLEEKMETEDESEDRAATEITFISQSSMKTVIMVHQQLCLNFARSLWYQQTLPSHQAKHYFSTFLSCYQTGASLVTRFYPLIGAEMNDCLLGSQLLASTLLHNTLFAGVTSDLVLHQDGPYDFYQYPNIQQVRQCQPVLDNFAKEVNKLLQEWPEHPALVQLIVVLDRIRSFPLSSPLSKFLNGLEILLAKSQDWENNASRALSLRKHLDLVTQLIIQWRKLELNCWSVSLDNVMKRHSEKSTRHWFSIYQMIEKYMQEQIQVNTEETSEPLNLRALINTLQAFIEGSTLGEFHTRLQALLVFHCHVLLIPQVEGKDALCSVLWNLYNYYKQFSEVVQARITELRQPIEKELKEFVKISKWNDVSFWAIKQSVEKTHRTLFKFMKKFEAVLDEPCQAALVESNKEDQLDCLQKQEEFGSKESQIQRLNSVLRKTLSAKTEVVQTVLSEECQSRVMFHAESLQYRLPKLTKRMKKMCATLMDKSSFSDLVENLDRFTGDVIVSVLELQNLTFNQAAEKEKQKSEVKHIHMQKQRALSDLFKSLAKTGLSYRKGLAWSRSKAFQDMLCLHPLDLHSALAIVNCVRELDATLLAEISSAWDGCQKYFYRCLARNSRLQTALLAPVKEIGVGSIERCKGFTAHLMKMLVKQRSSLTALTEQWIILRNLLSCIQEIDSRIDAAGEYNVAFPPQDSIQQWTDRLQHLAMQFVMVLEQLSWFIQCCPREQSLLCSDDERTAIKTHITQCKRTNQSLGNAQMGIPDLIPSELIYPSPVTADQLPPGCKMRNQDQLWQQLAAEVTEMLAEVKAMKKDVDKIRQQSCETLFHSWKDFEVCTSGLSCLLKVSSQLQGLESLFVLPDVEGGQYARQMTLIKSLEYIQEEVNKTAVEFATWKEQLLTPTSNCHGNQESDESFVEHFSERVETAIRVVLCAIQCLVERNQGKEEEKSPEEDEEASGDGLKAGHLTKLLDEDLSADLSSLHMQKIISAISELLERLKSYGEDCMPDKRKFFNQSCYLLVRLLPMLCKYSDLILFYLMVSLTSHRSTGKLLSVLTSIFTELAQKGFCLPKELMEEEAGEGATEFHDYEGGGIGDGEGKKDVSDKIENENQVEDTRQKGQEKEKEDPDSKPDIEGEDNAIEMSEDFEGKMHEGEQDKKEEDDKSDEDEELDKQMGNLGDAEADKLNERLWGDDDEEDEDESGDNKTEEMGPGMDEGDSELVAKDDNLDAGKKNDDKKQPLKDEKEEQAEDGGNQEKIHEQIDEEYDENEVDPYHGKQEKQPEVEALDLPDDLNLEKEEEKSDEENEGEGGENPFDIEEKLVDLNGKDKNEEDTEDRGREDQDPGLAEDKGEGEDGGDKAEEDEEEKEAADQEEGNTERPEETTEEDVQPPKEDKNESAEEEMEKGVLTADEGLQPQEEEDKDDPEKDEQLPESAERMEHETLGQTGEENLQSDTAVELAGAASEKDQAKEEHGTGSADACQSEGHESQLMARLASQKQSRKNTQSFKRKPGQADNERSMGDHNKHVHKRLRTIDSSSEAKQNTAQPEQHMESADAFEHIKQGSESYDAQTYDVASKEQQKPILPLSEEKEEVDSEDAAMETEMQNNEDLKAVDIEELKPDVKKPGITKNSGSDEAELEIQDVTDSSEDVKDSSINKQPQASEEDPERNKDSTIHTAHQYLMDPTVQPIITDPEELRQELERQLEAWHTQQPGSPDEERAAAEMWQRYLVLTAPLSQQLCEQLRLILEPTQAAKLKGDYRTGKRLNMRKVIPYIASQFRKDKIWLRRTKPSKRQYQICLAIDDSSSMIDNHSKQLAYESLAVIGNALTLLEVGQIAVCSFGETVQLLHPFHEQFSDESGTRILRLCKFEQKKTKIAQFLESSAKMFAAAQQVSQSINPETSQLLLIVSDGRGLFLEGKERVTAAVHAAQNANIFVIFVVLDNPNSRDSILDIKVPIFKGPGEMPEIRSYMEEFPFPFYIILRDVNALPETLSDALRQWFELVTASDSL